MKRRAFLIGAAAFMVMACRPPTRSDASLLQHYIDASLNAGKNHVRIPSGEYIIDETLFIRWPGENLKVIFDDCRLTAGPNLDGPMIYVDAKSTFIMGPLHIDGRTQKQRDKWYAFKIAPTDFKFKFRKQISA